MADEKAAVPEAVAEEQKPVNPEATADAKPNDGGENADPQGTQNQPDDENHPKRKGGWQRKIEKLERLNETLLTELLRRGQSQPEEKAKPEPELVEPDPEKFETVAEYLKAVRAYDRSVIQKELAQKFEEREQKTVQKTAEQKRQESWQSKVAEFSKEHPDFDDVVYDAGVPITKAMAEASFDSDLGPAIAYHLANNPEEAARIARLPEAAQIREIGKIEARLEFQKSEAGKPEAEAEPEKPAPPVSNAPPPVTPVKRSGPVKAPTINDEDLPFKDFVKLREEQIKKRAK